jgi:hypothetical protein
MEYGSLLSHIKCTAGKAFCKIVVKLAFSTEFEVDVSGVSLRLQSAPKLKFFQRIVSFWLKNPSWLKPFSRLRSL